MKNSFLFLITLAALNMLSGPAKIFSSPELLMSTYYGGSGGEYGIAVASDENENLYITGMTSSVNFPVTSGAFQTTNAGGSDMFIIKFNSLGQRIWATYYGGSGSEQGRAIVVDKDGNILITGYTMSNNFPVSPDAYQTTNAGSEDLFIVKFSSQGERIWATYYGGSSIDEAYGISIDNFRNVFVDGYTQSNNFPVTPGAIQTYNAGVRDVFIIKFNNLGQRVWATYFGGTAGDEADAIYVDLNGNVLLTGYTNSINFPITPGAFQANYAGNSDIFITKLSSFGQCIWSTFYGGSNEDQGYGGISTDVEDNICICGWTMSSNFPVSEGAFQTSLAGNNDAFIIKLDSTGQRQWATYYGGSNDDRGEGVEFDSSNNITFSGYTNSLNFPVSPETYQQSNAGNYDAFIGKFSPSGQRYWASYFGGSNSDRSHLLISTINCCYVLTGRTNSLNLPVTSGAFQTNNAGGDDVFITLFSNDPTGIKPAGKKIPREFGLHQNYPNPFNPVTKIKFDLPPSPLYERGEKGGFVTLIIFDILGREVTTLVNEQLKPGSYEIQWDASNYPNGVYFYGLTANEFKETKKMVLVK